MATPGLAPHPETPNLEVPLGLFVGVRTWLQFLLGFMFLYLFFFSDFSRCFLAPQCI